MKSNILTALATLLVASDAYSKDALVLKSRPSQLGMEILPPKQDPWYTAPPNFELAAPGQILRIRAARGNITTVQANSSEVYNILYRTTDSQYKPTWAVTTLLIPNNTQYNSSDKLLSYQIPYDSADLNASPSYSMYAGGLPDVTAALGRGWYVNVPDYEGPLASFTAGVMSGHATIDSVRAVLSSGFGLAPNGTKYALWGYSGGALASEWAAELQVQYASELNFAGAALGGLTPNITTVMEAVTGNTDAGLIPAGILGLATQWPELEQYITSQLNPKGMYNATGFLEARNYTLVEGIIAFLGENITDYFKPGTNLFSSAAGLKATNRDGIMGYHGVPQMPIFAYKAIHDEVSPINDTDKLVASYCGVGATILYERNTIGDHSQEAVNGDARAVQFLEQVLSGGYNATGCQIMNVTVNATAVA